MPRNAERIDFMSHQIELAEIRIGHQLDQNELFEAIARKPSLAHMKDFILGIQGESIWERIINHRPSMITSVWQGQLLACICSL